MSSQARESGFNPSSPHSSSAKADSYKHEGTPDTHLTAFSPDENSARSNKLFTSLSLSASDPQPLRFPGKPNNVFRPTLGLQNADKDPFIAASSNDKPDQRLSPTANDFQPNFSLSLAAQGHEENLTRGTINSAGPYSPLVVPGIANGFSNGVGLSRYIVLQSSVQSLTADDANAFFKVCLASSPSSHDTQLTTVQHLDRHGMSFKGKHWVTPHKDKLYFRFTNILDAWLVYHNAPQGGSAWHADLIRPDLWQVSKASLSFVCPCALTLMYSCSIPTTLVTWRLRDRSSYSSSLDRIAPTLLPRLKPLCTACSTKRQRYSPS